MTGAAILTSCLGTKYLKKDEYLLAKQNIISSKEVNKEELEGQLAQKRNSHLGPISLPVHAYQVGKKHFDTARIKRKIRKTQAKYDRKISQAKRQKKINQLIAKKTQKLDKKETKLKEGNGFMRWGEPLAIYDSGNVELSRQNLLNYLFTEGYFKAKVNTSINYRDRLVDIEYKVIEGPSYQIDSLVFNIKDEKIKEVFNEEVSKQNLLNRQYNQDLFSKERDRVYTTLSNQGYYDFKRQYILFQIDSTALDEHGLLVRETIANPSGRSHHKAFKIDSIVFVNEAANLNSGVQYEHINFLLNKKKYPVNQLAWRIFLNKDSLYSKEMTLETQRQLAYLDIFKFVNINYDTTSGQFVANIFTRPLKKFQTSWEAGLSVLESTHNLPGPFFSFNTKSRNPLGALEIIQFDGNVSIQGIQSFNENSNNYSRLQYGGQLSVTWPRFMFPLKNSVQERIGRYNPRTKLTSGVSFEDRINEYQRTTFKTSFAYFWQLKDNSQFNFKLFDINYIQSDTMGVFAQELSYLESLGYFSLVNAFKPSIVSFSSFGFTYNPNQYGQERKDASLFQGYFEVGGNIQKAVSQMNWYNNLGSLEDYQYLKANFDYRHTNLLTRKSQLAYRINVGAAYAYGNKANRALPYEKYFFAGGSNSIRAWKPRRLGPGAYAQYESSDGNSIVVDDNREQPGDILLETSIEYRHDLIGFVDLGLFIDAGNIWLWESQTIEKGQDGSGNDDGVFRLKTFPREIAVGTGFGLRFDFSFLILRVDMAYKIVDPAYPLGERFRLNTYQVNDLWDLQDKAALNIGIGYPF